MKAVRTISSVAVQLRSAIVVSILSTALGHAAHACQCDSTVQTPCNSLSHSGVVFIGTVKSIENRPWSEFWSFSKFYSGMSLRDRLAIFRDEVIVNFSVEETYKGSPARELSIRVGKFGGSCGFEYKPGELYFKKGEQYLVYAGFYGGPFLDKSNADGHLRTNHCSGTTLASNATEKIKAYRALKGLQRPLVLGRYDFQPEFNKKAPARAQRVTLVPRTGTRLNALVQEDGSFLLTSVPSATYTLASTTAKNYRLGFGNPETINVEADSCTEIELVAIPDGTLSGTVISSNGQPLSGATVRLWNTNDVSGLEHWWGGQQTDARGKFSQGPLSPGRYVVGVYVWSPDQERSLRQGQDANPSLWFYPGVSRPNRAKVITLGFAEHRSGIQFRIPKNPQ